VFVKRRKVISCHRSQVIMLEVMKGDQAVRFLPLEFEERLAVQGGKELPGLTLFEAVCVLPQGDDRYSGIASSTGKTASSR
jgi:hypothetical protein